MNFKFSRRYCSHDIKIYKYVLFYILKYSLFENMFINTNVFKAETIIALFDKSLFESKYSMIYMLKLFK